MKMKYDEIYKFINVGCAVVYEYDKQAHGLQSRLGLFHTWQLRNKRRRYNKKRKRRTTVKSEKQRQAKAFVISRVYFTRARSPRTIEKVLLLNSSLQGQTRK